MSYLRLLRVPISLTDLARYSSDRGWGWTTRRTRNGYEAGAGFDVGRALHHVLDEAFGKGQIKPFRLMSPYRRNTGTVYAYTRLAREQLLDTLSETGTPEFSNGRILRLSDLDTKQMPDNWAAGKRLAFDTRIRPVVRLRTQLSNPRPGQSPYKRGAELDAFLVEAQRNHADERPGVFNGDQSQSGMAMAGRDRAHVYQDWLAARLDGAAELDLQKTEMVAFHRSRVSRGHASVEGPDATFHGELVITNPQRFGELLAKGVGRHRSFGYGMLLLRPSRRT